MNSKSSNSFTERMRSKLVKELGLEDDSNKITFWILLEYLLPGVKFRREMTPGGVYTSLDFENINYMQMYVFDQRNVEFLDEEEEEDADGDIVFVQSQCLYVGRQNPIV